MRYHCRLDRRDVYALGFSIPTERSGSPIGPPQASSAVVRAGLAAAGPGGSVWFAGRFPRHVPPPPALLGGIDQVGPTSGDPEEDAPTLEEQRELIFCDR